MKLATATFGIVCNALGNCSLSLIAQLIMKVKMTTFMMTCHQNAIQNVLKYAETRSTGAWSMSTVNTTVTRLLEVKQYN